MKKKSFNSGFRNTHTLILFSLIVSGSCHLFAQTTSAVVRSPFIRFSTQNGTFIGKEGAFFNSIDENGNAFQTSLAYSLEYGWKMLGGKEWHQINNYPRIGFGINYLSVRKRNEFGNPFSVYAFYNGKIFSRRGFEVISRMTAGLGYVSSIYDPSDSFPNDVIATRLNSFLEVGFGASINLSDRLTLEPGVRLSHLSNGNTREPQVGMNILSYSLGLSSYFGARTEPLKMPVRECLHRNEVLVYAGFASRQIEFRTHVGPTRTNTFGMNYLMANVHFSYLRELSHRFKLGGGVDLFYDGTNGQQELAWNGVPDKGAVAFKDKTGVGVFLDIENVIDRFSFVGSLGYIVLRTEFESSTPAFEQRLGFKYHFYRNVFVGANVRAYNFNAAKAIEFTIGTRRFF